MGRTFWGFEFRTELVASSAEFLPQGMQRKLSSPEAPVLNLQQLVCALGGNGLVNLAVTATGHAGLILVTATAVRLDAAPQHTQGGAGLIPFVGVSVFL
ncbi:MAG: hypothetical protein WCP28_15310 [Actinomycetes bacterium]